MTITFKRRVTGHPIPATNAPRRQGDPAVLVASSEKIQSELNWKPEHPDLGVIIGSAWEWHQRHSHGYSG
jgi:UDP-glucose 4-epimerase